MADGSRTSPASDPAPGPERGSIAAADGVEIAFDVAGSGEPALVFVHGWAGNRHHWDEQLDAFAASHQIVRIDLAGHGDSGTTRTQWSMSSLADDVVAVVDTLGLRRVVLIGHSMGGSVALAAGVSLGDRTAGVVGVDTWSGLGGARHDDDPAWAIPLPEMREDFVAGATHFAHLMCGPSADAELVRRITDEVTSMPPDVAVGVLEGAGIGFDLEAGLRALDAPVSAISSEHFRPKDDAAFAAAGITNVTMADTGHYLMLERPEEFDAHLAAAIARPLG